MNPTLEQMVEALRSYRMTPEERREQRISLIMGLRHSKSTLTREHVERLVREGA